MEERVRVCDWWFPTGTLCTLHVKKANAAIDRGLERLFVFSLRNPTHHDYRHSMRVVSLGPCVALSPKRNWLSGKCLLAGGNGDCTHSNLPICL